MLSAFNILKNDALKLRKSGRSYGEIREILKAKIPKSTLSYWFKDILLSDKNKHRIKKIILSKAEEGRIKALKTNKDKRGLYLESIKKKVSHLPNLIDNKEIAKLALTMLYLGEGSKTRRGALMFGNSNPDIIKLFLKILRTCYDVDESKFRCTVQCRADQDPTILKEFWFDITKIPRGQFYKPRIDLRTIGRPSRKLGYKGVCRIDYFSADIYNELIILCDLFGKI